jgi:hypothetical protein
MIVILQRLGLYRLIQVSVVDSPGPMKFQFELRLGLQHSDAHAGAGIFKSSLTHKSQRISRFENLLIF